MAGFAVAAGLVAWRLSSGPVSIEFLAPYLERALAPADEGFSVTIDHTILTWGGWDKAIEIRALDLKAVSTDGQVIAAIPEMNVKLSARALLLGEIAPTALAVLRPHLTIQRAADGRFSMGMNPADHPTGPFVSNLVAGLLTQPGGGALSYLRVVSVVEGALTVRDAHLGYSWYAPSTNLVLYRDATGVRGEVSTHLDIEGRTISLDGIGIYSRSQKVLEVGLNFTGLEPALFARSGESAGVLEALRIVQLPLDGVINATIGDDGRVQKVGFELRGDSGTIDLPEPFDQTYRIASFYMRGTGNEDLDQLTVDTFDVRTDGPRLSGTIEVSDVRVRPKAKLGLSVTDMPIDALRNYWPGGAGRNARRWVLANMSDGVVKEMSATIEATAEDSRGGLGSDFEVEAISGAMIYEGLTINYMSPLPPARDVSGSATFSHDRFDFTAAGGDFAGLDVDRATIAITGLMANEQRAKIDGRLRGSLRDALAIVDSEPFRYAQKLGVTPAQVSGAATIDLSFDFPLVDDLTFEQVDLTGSATLRNVAWKKALYGLDLTDGDLALAIDKNAMRISGKAKIAGAAADLAWTEHFTDTQKVRTQLQVKGTFDQGVQKALGFDLSTFLTGPVGADVRLTEYDRGRATIDTKLDLTQTDFDLSFIGASKRAGAPGTAELRIDLANGRATGIPKF
ncbi:MAG TPA: DUF3971 domain-containing protein, partial [Alphaproteobacteria bacterium]